MLYMEQRPSPFSWVRVEDGDHGERVVVEAGDVIRTDPSWLHDHFPDMLHGDEVWLDSAGEHRYRPSEDRVLQREAGGFTAYERIQP